MLNSVLIYLNTILQGIPLFKTVWGLCELRPDKNGIQVPVFWNGNQFERIKFNEYGLTYWRKRSQTTIENIENRTSCRINQSISNKLRLFVLVKRQYMPQNLATTPDALAYQLIKNLTSNNGTLRRDIGANYLEIRAKVYSTDSAIIINQELSGIERLQFNLDDIVIALDVDINIHTNVDCIEDVCEAIPRFCLQLESYVALP
jgi:hypothetical protein